MKIKDNMHISDKKLDEYFNDIEECVDAVKGHQQTLKADEIKDCIKQVWPYQTGYAYTGDLQKYIVFFFGGGHQGKLS